MTDFPEIAASVKALELTPSSLVVVTLSEPISREQAEHLNVCVKAMGLPCKHVIVSDASVTASARDDGLTDEEGVVMDHLLGAVNAFVKLRRQHPDEGRDFRDGIHRCQDALALRVCRRAFPIGWPDKGPEPMVLPETSAA